MANTTVYPFGTGGSLPSNIGIINDLTTGGVDKALSAQQGVVLNDKITENLSEVALSTLPTFPGLITATGVWTDGNNHKFTQIPVEPGEKYRIVAHATNYSSYAFFTEMCFWSSGGTPSFSEIQSGRTDLSANTTTDVVVPSDTHYLYIGIYNASYSQDVAPQHIYLVSDPETKYRSVVEDKIKKVLGSPSEMCNYDTDSFVFNSTATNGSVEKVGSCGYLIKNTKSSTGRYFKYTLPSSLVNGKTYVISFDYTAWLSAQWAFVVVESDTATYASPTRSIYIPASGKGRISYHYTHLEGDTFLRLASASQSAGCALLIENLSIVEDTDTIESLTQRVRTLEGGMSESGTVTTYPYYGRRIDITERSYSFGEYMSMSTHQSSARYGNYVVTFSNQMTSVKLYNIYTQTLLATVTQEALDSLHHCNQSFFGTEFYAEGDAFPLVYITVNNNAETPCRMEAYRIVPTMGDTDYTSFTITLVQTVSLPLMSETNALGNANSVLDTESGYLYTYSRNDDSSASNYQKCRITKWNMPTLSQGNVTLTDADRLDSWEVDTSAAYMQGATIKNHLLFIFRGYQSVGLIELHVFDLIRKDRVALIDLLSDGFTMEPEGAFFWDNVLCTTNGTMYRFLFK